MWRGLFKGCDSYHSPKPVPGNVLLTRCGEWGGEAGPCCGRVSVVSVSDGAVVMADKMWWPSQQSMFNVPAAFSSAVAVQQAQWYYQQALQQQQQAALPLVCVSSTAAIISLTSYSRSLFPYFLIFLFHCTLNIYIAHLFVKNIELLSAASKT